jgi:DNA-binding beta-propeller fold protein YncE
MKRSLFLFCTAVAGLSWAATGTAAAAPTVSVVMSDLDNPRGLAFGPQGALYVAEAGRGDIGQGDGPCFTLGMKVCYGPTGAVSRLWHGVQTRVATGLPSFANGAGRAQGPNDIAMLGAGDAEVTIGLEASPILRDELSADNPEWAGFGRLVQVSAGGQWRFVADLGAFEEQANPHPRLVDTDPYGVLALPGATLVADAGGNDLVRVAANGEVSLLALLPPVPQAGDQEPVPSSVVVGPDGAYYAGEMTGAPFVDGASTIYRIAPGQAPEAYLSGFKAVIDLAFDAAGNLYVLQHATGPTTLMLPGKLIRVAPDGTRTTVLDGLDRPTSVAIGPDGALYVTNHGLSVGDGEVLRIQP